ncbi:hypothetical protein [Algibacter sp. Ld11]|uniref:hypothetical protein n=1 Tax=Algibacter sp. Ld11 TaxID=649150 RepID=UPI00386B4983
MRKYVILLAVILLQLPFVGCKDDSGICLLGITSLKLTNAAYLEPLDNTQATVESFEYRAILEFPEPDTKPNPNGKPNACVLSFDKLHTPVSDFSITSNVKLFNTAPGEPIDLENFNIYQCNLLLSGNYTERDDMMNTRYSIKNWINLLNAGSEDKNFFKPFRKSYIEFADKNERVEVEGMTLKFSITLDDGTQFTAETRPVNLG